jgi:hypothetical protein
MPRHELAEDNDVAWYQQRGLAPSAAEGPFTVATDVGDARRVLEALRWDKAYVAGHSWGGQLALHVAEALPVRQRTRSQHGPASGTRGCDAKPVPIGVFEIAFSPGEALFIHGSAELIRDGVDVVDVQVDEGVRSRVSLVFRQIEPHAASRY